MLTPPTDRAVVAEVTTTKSKCPVTLRSNEVDNYFGTQVADPYRWLELIDSKEVRNWVREQNGYSRPYLDSLPYRSFLRHRLTQLWDYERFETPIKAGGKYFFKRNNGKQDQSVLFVTNDLNCDGHVLLDPNTLVTDATAALTDFAPSPNGLVVAYAVSDSGKDWQSWRFRRVDTSADMPDFLGNTKFWGVSWARDSSGVYYSLYPCRGDGKGDDSRRPDIYFHELGTPQEQDRLVYQVGDHPSRVPYARVTEDGRYLVVTLIEGELVNGVDLLYLDQPSAPAFPLFPNWDALYKFIGAGEDELYFHTTNSAPNGRAIAVNTTHPQPSCWRVIVPEASMAIESVKYVSGCFIVAYIKDAHTAIYQYDSGGRLLGEVPLPSFGTGGGFTGEGKDVEAFFSYTDYVTPASIYRYEPSTKTASLWRSCQVQAITDLYVTQQVFYSSNDGTRVPMFLTHRRCIERDGNHPTLLYGYGGFNRSATPIFRAHILAWLEMGGVFAEANLRGGGEYGEAWHTAGTRNQKQNVFDDFISAAEYLIRTGYTNPKRLAIHGRSNGGLLVGAAMLQRPDLFGAALPVVGLFDMLRYQKMSANARKWSSEYGVSDNAEDFKAQYAYSPVHNVVVGSCYPATLITTADYDDRVVPWHSFKFAAALQHAQGCGNPILLRVDTRTGHGGGKPVWMQIEDYVDQWAFVASALGMQPPVLPGNALNPVFDTQR